MFTKQHYEAIAKIINGHTLCNQPLVEKQGLVEALANMLAEDPGFDGDRFLRLCYKDNPRGGDDTRKEKNKWSMR